MASPGAGPVNRGPTSPPASAKYYAHGDGPLLPRTRATGHSWTKPDKLYVALACVVLLAITGILQYSRVHRGTSIVSEATSSNFLYSQAVPEQQNMSAAMQALSNKQEQMMEMLRGMAQVGVVARLQSEQQLQEELQQKQQQDSIVDAAVSAAADAVPAAIVALPVLTKLHNTVLRSSKDYQQHRTVMKQLLDRLVHMEASAADKEAAQQLLQQLSPLKQFVYELYKLLLASGRLIPCREDTTLVMGDAILWPSSSSSDGSDTPGNSSSSSSTPRYYFAANLRDNSVQMPQFVLSLLQTLLRLPHDTAFVSIYESNSDEGVHGWIDVLQLALNVIGTPNRLVARGMLVRTEEQNRIEFLAQVRNMAMAPLYARYDETKHRAAAETNSIHGSSSSSSSSKSAPPGMLPWNPDYVAFINDVYFCWSMVLRLLQYRADITCGMDFWQNKDATVSLPFDQRSKGHQAKPAIPAEYRLEAPLKDALSADQENPIVFYDVWVARDLAGSKLWWTYPFIMDSQSSHVVAEGLPVRASCCWNGIAVLAAEPFMKGVRFRTHNEDGECRASECTLLCEDFARLGYDRVVIDSGVQVAYDWELAREMLSVGVEGVGQSAWSQVKAAGITEATRQPAYSSMECCSLQPGAQWVHFYTDCSRRDINARNYTADALAMSAWKH